MTICNSNHLSLASGSLEPGNTSAKMSLSGVFNNRNGVYLNELTLFVAHFNAIPNFIHEINIDCKKVNAWMVKNYSAEIRDHYFNKRYYNGSKKAELDDVFYFLFEDLLIDVDTARSTVRFLFRKTDQTKVEEMISGVRRFKKRTGNSEIQLITQSAAGLTTNPLNISKPKMDIGMNYNDDFMEVHQTILRRLSRKNDKGLVLLHGKPGTGKTSYIRYLISLIKKRVIFLPPNMAAAITNPELISVLTENPDSVFVIEDAEKIISDRNQEGHSPVSVLLNISDGLLSDCLNIQVICTFNTDISRIDQALIRKGRLIARYEFKELTVEKSRQLSHKLGFHSEINSSMTLAAIYNQDEQDFNPVQNCIRVHLFLLSHGFNSHFSTASQKSGDIQVIG